MDATYHSNLTATDLESLLAQSRTQGQVVVLFARCSAEWSGNRNGKIGSGDRVIICKPDGAIAIHRPSGARAVARQGIRSSVEVHELPDCILLYGQKSGGRDTLRVQLEEIELCVQAEATDDAEVEEFQTEDRMHEFIEANPESIEEGLRILHHEYQVPQGVIDFLAADTGGNVVIIEVKHPAGKATHVDQLLRYVKQFRRTEDATVRGILVAPTIGNQASRILRKNELESCELDKFEQHNQSPSQTSFEDWI